MNRFIFHCVFSVTLLASAVAFAVPVTVRDAAGRSVTIAESRRIVAIGGAVTEILYALGAQDRVVAVDTTSVYPPDALKDKPNVGYMRQLSPEGVLGLNPTLILAMEGAGPRETIAVLEAASVPLVLVPDRHDGAAIVDKIRLIAKAVGREANGECLAAAVEADLAALARLRANIERPERALFLLSLVNDKAMVGGKDTSADGILRLAGAANAMAEHQGFKIVNDEAIIAAAPDAVIGMRRGAHALSAESLFALPSFAVTPAAKRKTLIVMDGLYLLGFGPRTARAARDLAAALYPQQLAGAKLPSERDADAFAQCSR